MAQNCVVIDDLRVESVSLSNITLNDIQLSIKNAIKEAFDNFSKEVVIPLKAELLAIKSQNSALQRQLELLQSDRKQKLTEIKNPISYANAAKASKNVRNKPSATLIDDNAEQSNKTTLNSIPKSQTETINKLIHINSDIQSPNAEKYSTDKTREEKAAEWHVQTNKRNRAKTLTTGTGANDSMLQGVQKRMNFHVSRAHPKTNTADIKEHLIKTGITDPIVEQVLSKHPESYSSFKVSVLPDFKEKILMPANWPSGICVNRFLWSIQKPMVNG
ncbi:hypothetical protein RI129_009430 [Pyrocoelia pectoralis]|uniref:Uncharacterized protein n=1 Tax=Pyrocoelia pectoralis TaxID=417401 RepID=A0AAN7ZIY8_9COLE